jgi:hypothetical protein
MAHIEAHLAAMCDWIAGAQVATPTWRMTSHEMRLDIGDDQARALEDHDE